MTDSTQTHHGGGDNVGRDKKVINISFPTKILAIAIVSIAVVFFAYQNRTVLAAKLGWDKVFSKNDTHFKILVLPFQIMCKDNPSKDIGKEIADRLRDLNLKDTLNIYPYYFADYAVPANFSYETAEQLQKYHRADLIIYGSYYDDQCTEVDGEEVCYNWITDDKWVLDTLQQNTFTAENYRVATMQDIRDGKIQGGTDYIIYWFSGITAYEQTKYQKAAAYWLRIREDLGINNYSLANKLGSVFQDLGQYNTSLRYYLEMLAFASSEQDTAVAFNNLANVYQDLGQYERARDLLEKALASDIHNFGEQHPTVATDYNNLIEVYAHFKQWDKAQEASTKSLDIWLKTLGAAHPYIKIAEEKRDWLQQQMEQEE